MTKRRISILGSTGSVGCSTVDLIKRHPENFDVIALTAHSNVEMLVEQTLLLKPKFISIANERYYQPLKDALAGVEVEIASGADSVTVAAGIDADWIMASIVGAAGLKPTLRAIQQGGLVSFANKECLVCAGDLVMEEVAKHGATLLPTDSEHNAIFQVFSENQRESIDHLILTASGGPFRLSDKEFMRTVKPAQALAHPNWDMGAKISIDSATMMNKGLEIIEARYLFDMTDDLIEVLVHPQSIIHSMVAYVDGSVLAQMGTPDMRTPIGHCLAWPDRMAVPCEKLDFVKLARMDFHAPDLDRFPALTLAREALRAGNWATTVLNATNEVAVAAFLNEKIGFLDIANLVDRVLSKSDSYSLNSLDDVMSLDQETRSLANELAAQINF